MPERPDLEAIGNLYAGMKMNRYLDDQARYKDKLAEMIPDLIAYARHLDDALAEAKKDTERLWATLKTADEFWVNGQRIIRSFNSAAVFTWYRQDGAGVHPERTIHAAIDAATKDSDGQG